MSEANHDLIRLLKRITSADWKKRGGAGAASVGEPAAEFKRSLEQKGESSWK